MKYRVCGCDHNQYIDLKDHTIPDTEPLRKYAPENFMCKSVPTKPIITGPEMCKSEHR
jgi:hypothetical protein